MKKHKGTYTKHHLIKKKVTPSSRTSQQLGTTEEDCSTNDKPFLQHFKLTTTTSNNTTSEKDNSTCKEVVNPLSVTDTSPLSLEKTQNPEEFNLIISFVNEFSEKCPPLHLKDSTCPTTCQTNSTSPTIHQTSSTTCQTSLTSPTTRQTSSTSPTTRQTSSTSLTTRPTSSQITTPSLLSIPKEVSKEISNTSVFVEDEEDNELLSPLPSLQSKTFYSSLFQTPPPSAPPTSVTPPIPTTPTDHKTSLQSLPHKSSILLTPPNSTTPPRRGSLLVTSPSTFNYTKRRASLQTPPTSGRPAPPTLRKQTSPTLAVKTSPLQTPPTSARQTPPISRMQTPPTLLQRKVSLQQKTSVTNSLPSSSRKLSIPSAILNQRRLSYQAPPLSPPFKPRRASAVTMTTNSDDKRLAYINLKQFSCPNIERRSSVSNKKGQWFRSQNSIIVTDEQGFYSILELSGLQSHWKIMNKRRKGLHLLRIIVRISLWIQKSRDNHEDQTKPQTLAELNYYSRYTAFETGTMIFNKSEFSRLASCNATIPLWARFVMEENASIRTSANIKKLVILFKHLRAFHEALSPTAQEEYCRHCQYMCVEERQLILRAGHPSYFSYLIISGSVFVNVEDEDPTSGKKCYRTTNVLKEGALFGDVSLVRKLPRFANYIARERTELIVLDEQSTVKLLAAGINRDLSLRINYIKEHKVFAGWPEEVVIKLSGHCETVNYPFDAIIDKDVSNSPFLYMITEGTVEVLTFSDLALDDTTTCTRTCAPTHTDDYFSDLGLFQRVKSPNQCNKYRNLSLTNQQAFISLELLSRFDISDLRSLLPSSSSFSSPLLLVSHGAKVMKIPKHRLHCVPSIYWRQLLVRAKSSPRYPAKEVLYRVHSEYLQWNIFKSLLVHNVIEVIDKKAFAMKPTFHKGQCGWVKPSVPPLVNIDTQYKDCMSSDIPLCYHRLSQGCHSGPCLMQEVVTTTLLVDFNSHKSTVKV